MVSVLVALAGCAQTILVDPLPKSQTIVEACADARETLRVDVTFPAREPGCAWGEGGNREPEQGLVTARAEDEAPLDLPDDVVICDLGFDFGVDAGTDDDDDDDDPVIRYDDNFLLTFGDVVLAASYAPMVETFITESVLRLYDWDRLVGFPFGFEDAGTYCLGAEEGLSSCSVPPPETPGPLALDFGEPVVAALAERAYTRADYTFGFITIGDNDADVDCAHSAFTFEVDVAYTRY